jgi:hypothetical protein
MSRSPISVKGLRRIADGLTDQVLKTLKHEGVRALARLDVDADFQQEQNGEWALRGSVETIAPIGGVPAEVEADPEVERGTKHSGTGNLHITFEIEVR